MMEEPEASASREYSVKERASLCILTNSQTGGRRPRRRESDSEAATAHREMESVIRAEYGSYAESATL